jgi:hypothetical protein
MPVASARELKLGLVGLDTSHVVIFSDHFNNPSAAHHLSGARVVAAWPGGSPDLPSSIGRVPGYTAEVRDKFGVAIVDSPEAVAQACDAILLTSLDGRVHRAQFERLAPFGKPVFVDKPFAVNSADARAVFASAEQHGVRLFSSSSLRFAESLAQVVTPATRALVRGADFSGPMELEPTNPGFYWYGIHAVEMLYTAMGRGCRSVRAVQSGDFDLALGQWADGRLGTVRGNRTKNYEFRGSVHFADRTAQVNAGAGKSFFTSLAEVVLAFCQGGPAPVEPAETIELIRFIEAANESRAHGGREVAL